MKKGTKYLRKLARVGKVYPKVISTKLKSKSRLSLNNQSNPLNK